MWMWIVANQLEVLVLEVEEALYIRIDLHRRQWTRLTCELQLCLFDVVQIEVGVACGVNEVTRLIARYLCHHLEQQRVRGDIERDTQEGIGTALIKLKRSAVASYVELEDGVTRGQCHLVYLGHIPC